MDKRKVVLFKLEWCIQNELTYVGLNLRLRAPIVASSKAGESISERGWHHDLYNSSMSLSRSILRRPPGPKRGWMPFSLITVAP
ncbi:hypothetical protein GALL_510310 [mine drainage metagenome]|uniref:Uncharacterized protein n=1 Tax=mine drainage metagenome TaxID=410659 RepID=A0A1J5PV00_9ZZZZ